MVQDFDIKNLMSYLNRYFEYEYLKFDSLTLVHYQTSIWIYHVIHFLLNILIVDLFGNNYKRDNSY